MGAFLSADCLQPWPAPRRRHGRMARAEPLVLLCTSARFTVLIRAPLRSSTKGTRKAAHLGTFAGH